MASSALAAACLRHQRTVFFASVAAGACFSFATGQSALDALPTPRGAPPTAGTAAHATAEAAVPRALAGESKSPCILEPPVAALRRGPRRAGGVAREGQASADAAQPLRYSLRLQHAPPYN